VPFSSNHTRPRLSAHGQVNSSPRCNHTKQHTNCNPNRSSYELPYYEEQVRWHTKHTFHCSRPGPTMALRIQYGFHYITSEIKQTHKERYAGIYMYNPHRFYISCINTTVYMYWSINDVQQLKITTNTNGNVYILSLAQLKFYTGWSKSLYALDDYSTYKWFKDGHHRVTSECGPCYTEHGLRKHSSACQ
jgi:hypothetical protein